MIPLLTPIRFYDPNVTYGGATAFQNPDNRVSTGYNYNGVHSMQYYLPIPRQWPDGQPGIDILINDSYTDISADLYDENDEFYVSLIGEYWGTGVTRFTLNGNDGDGVADGLYTIKIFDYEDELIYESEALLIGEWFDNYIPFEYYNFENDFGMRFFNPIYADILKYTGRILVPIIMQDPVPEFEKETYKDDPGTLTTLRTTMQRVFNFESLPLPVHVAEQFVMAFANSELYLNRIKINSEEAPEAELIKGTNLKQITGKATLVNFNDSYERESVETVFAETSVEWSSSSGYLTPTISGDTFTCIATSLPTDAYVLTDSYTHTEDEVILIKITLTNTNNSDLPKFSYSSFDVARDLVWGDNWISVRFGDAGSTVFRLVSSAGDGAWFQAELSLFRLT